MEALAWAEKQPQVKGMSPPGDGHPRQHLGRGEEGSGHGSHRAGCPGLSGAPLPRHQGRLGRPSKDDLHHRHPQQVNLGDKDAPTKLVEATGPNYSDR